MQTIKNFGLIILVVILWIIYQKAIDSYNPCSMFSQYQGDCSSDRMSEKL